MEIEGYNLELRKTKNGSSSVKVPQEIFDYLEKKKEEDRKKEGRRYVFTITAQNKKLNQTKLKEEIKSLLRESYVDFKLFIEDDEDEDKKEISEQSFEFKSQVDARDFALKILNTGAIFYCSLEEKN